MAKTDIKWRCHICDNEFTSESEQDFIEDARTHLSVCAGIDEFIERIE